MKRILSVVLMLCLCAGGALALADYDPYVPDDLAGFMNYVLPRMLEAMGVTSASEKQEAENYLGLSFTEQQDSVLYYNNTDWTVELSFYAEKNAGRNRPADAVNLVLSNDLADDDLRTVLYDFCVSVCYGRDDMDPQELLNWALEDPDPANLYHTALGDFSNIPNSDALQLALLRTEDTPVQVETGEDEVLIDEGGVTVTLSWSEPYASQDFPAAILLGVNVDSRLRRETRVEIESARVNGVAVEGIGLSSVPALAQGEEDFLLLTSETRTGMRALTRPREAVLVLSIVDSRDNSVLGTNTVYLDMTGMPEFTPAPTARVTPTPTPRPTARPTATPVVADRITTLDFSQRQWAEWEFEGDEMRIRFEMTAGNRAVRSFELYVYAVDSRGNKIYGDKRVYYGTTVKNIQAGRTAYSDYLTLPDESRIARVYCGIKQVTLTNGIVQEVSDAGVDYVYWEIE